MMSFELADWVASYSEGKAALSKFSGMPEDLLHVHAGLLIFVLAALLLRRKLRSALPLGFVAGFAILNEVVDHLSGQAQTTMEPLWDVVNTVFWPAILFLLARKGR